MLYFYHKSSKDIRISVSDRSAVLCMHAITQDSGASNENQQEAVERWAAIEGLEVQGGKKR